MQWLLIGPDAQTMSSADVAAYLRISVSTLERLVTDGRFPQPIKISARAEPFWTGLDVAAWMHLASRMQPEKVAEKATEKPGKKVSEEDS